MPDVRGFERGDRLGVVLLFVGYLKNVELNAPVEFDFFEILTQINGG